MPQYKDVDTRHELVSSTDENSTKCSREADALQRERFGAGSGSSRSGKTPAESGVLLFQSVHELQTADSKQPSQLSKDLGALNTALQPAGITLAVDSQYSNQIHLDKNGEPSLTATYLKAGNGRDTQVITDQSNDVISGGITYYRKDNSGQEIAVSHGSTKDIPTEGMFEDTPMTNQSEFATALQRLQVMHSMGIRSVTLAVDEGSPQYLRAYANAANELDPPVSIMWNISADKEGTSRLVWRDPSSTDGAAQFEQFRDAYETENNQNSPPTNQQLLKYIVQQLSDLPNTAGYYAADDSNVPSHASPGLSDVTDYLKQLRELDPNSDHEIMVGAYGAAQRKTLETALKGIGTVGNEEYPVYNKNDKAFSTLGPDGTPYLTEQNPADSADSPAGVKADVHATQEGASKNGEPTNIILQAFNWDTAPGGYAYPGYADQVGLRNIALTESHAQNIDWYWLPGTLGEAGVSGDPTGSKSTEFIASTAAAINAPLPDSNYWKS